MFEIYFSHNLNEVSNHINIIASSVVEKIDHTKVNTDFLKILKRSS